VLFHGRTYAVSPVHLLLPSAAAAPLQSAAALPLPELEFWLLLLPTVVVSRLQYVSTRLPSGPSWPQRQCEAETDSACCSWNDRGRSFPKVQVLFEPLLHPIAQVSIRGQMARCPR